ncbi:transposase [Psychromonas sp. SP041]|uniref:transposase n=1 Tax=Psychromonas sp. SP041 TaxID=1365007 RepID=UPI0004180540|nr:transposase [Psychromonas sp. SP041]
MSSNLFHIDQKNTVQFVTFRTHESVTYYLKKHNKQIIESTAKQQHQLDQFLDTSRAGAILNNETIPLLISLFKSKDKLDYNLFAVSIMPNHVHLLFQQIQPLSLIMQNIKGGSAFVINKYKTESGKLWEKSYYDKAIRTEKQFQITYQYIKNNAYKAELKDAKKRFYGVYESE